MPMMSPWPSKTTSWKWIALPLEHLCSMRCGPLAEKEGRSHKAGVLMFPRGGHFLLETHAEPALSLMMEFIKRTQRRNLPEGTPARLLRSQLRTRAPRRTTCVTWRAA
ncbi:hypothetical protein BQ8482_180182 [Mesorhizobium delmotii]|uniref:Uncharacterized protein n=1 Tax=Mesorhizobium delmotii TaxID=1631247 RepID=A0A2P9AIJ0_9HYPH|nr:hypothetical protein BQ8482_180182 [Mesorhizobium delmotii]